MHELRNAKRGICSGYLHVWLKVSYIRYYGNGMKDWVEGLGEDGGWGGEGKG